tara:strand:- start:1412 stop:1603 length:192 start_codon:yes stop_codon:yes gene_type:complete
MNDEIGYLGLFDKKEKKLNIIKENVLKGWKKPYKRPENFKEIEKKILVFLYGEMKLQMNYLIK